MASSAIYIIAIIATEIVLIGIGYAMVYAVRHSSVAAGRANQLQALLDVLDECVVVSSGLQIVAANESLSRLLETDKQTAENYLLSDFIRDRKALNKLVADETLCIETEVRTASGNMVAVEIAAHTTHDGSARQRIFEIRDIRERKAAQAKVEFLASHDPLTRLPNRETMHTCLKQAIADAKETGKCCALVWIDLDHFKEINDTLGHAMGDKCLCAVADKLVSDLAADYLVSRIGGDEFIVVCPSIPDALEARLVGQQIRRLLNQPFLFAGRDVNVGASIGVAVYPDNAGSAEELLKNADIALYRAKDNGRGIYQHFTKALSDEMARRNALSKRLPEAMKNGEIMAYFQPTVRAIDCNLTGFEALARWRHPDYGFIPPEEFVRIAEEQGLITELTDLIFRVTIRTAKEWPEHIRFSVNVTPPQINSQLIDQVRELTREYDFNPKQLEIEVTEDALIQDFENTSNMFSRLRMLGIQIAMDDFGTGYTSIANLRRLNFDRIKIDKVLTTDLPGHRRAAGIVKSMLVLARELGIAVTAEGIETEAQLEFLREYDFVTVQGYLFSRPLPASALNELKRFPSAAKPVDRVFRPQEDQQFQLKRTA
jgi:diguanylate cyclase (GGDEF)-like protein